jgi:hypothetical protein
MSCNNLKAPQPPTLESLPSNVKMPQGLSLDSVKGMASGKGLSDAMNNAQGMLSSNLAGLKDKMSPDAIAGKIGDTISGIADGIASKVNGAISSITSIGARIRSFDPSSAAGGIKSKLQGQLSGSTDFTSLASSLKSGKCAGSYVSEAGEFNKSISESAKNKLSGESRKNKRRMVSDQQFRQSKTEEITEEVKSDTYSSAVAQSSAKAKNQSAQDKLSSHSVESKSRSNPRGCGDYILHWSLNSFLPVNDIIAGAHVGYLYISTFQKVGSLFGGYTDDVIDVLDVIDAVRGDHVQGLTAKYYFRTVFNENPCGVKWDTIGKIDGEKIPGTGDKFSDGQDRNILEYLGIHFPGTFRYQNRRKAINTKWEGPWVIYPTWKAVYDTLFKSYEWDSVYIRNISDVVSSASNYNLCHRSSAALWVDDRPGQFGDTTKARDNFLKVIEKAQDKLFETLRANKQVLRQSALNAGNQEVADSIAAIIDDNSKVVGRDLIDLSTNSTGKTQFVWSIATVDWSSPEVTKVEKLNGVEFGKEIFQ